MVTLLRAPNPSPLTLDGTNGYVLAVGPGALVAIDPGVDDAAHIAAFVARAHHDGARYVAILVTHGHPDHYPGALALRRATGAPIYAHPRATFGHDRDLADGAELRFPAATLRALHAPGHAADHLVFWLEGERALFTGDVVLGSGTVVVAPPGGDMRAYQATLERLLRDYGDAAIIYGGHGSAVRAPRAKLEAYIAHRARREIEILEILAGGPATIPALVAAIYADVDEALWPAAARQMLAHLIALEREGRVGTTPLARAATGAERAVLEPDLHRLVGVGADVARAELGIGTEPAPLLAYARVGTGGFA